MDLKGKDLEELSLEELHKIAEIQNYNQDGINDVLLKNILQSVGFKKMKYSFITLINGMRVLFLIHGTIYSTTSFIQSRQNKTFLW